MPRKPPVHTGGCLCGAIRFAATGPADRPHTCTCTCKMCQRHTGVPATYPSSDWSSRAFCPTCGGSIGAIDVAPTIALLLGTFDRPNAPDLRPTYGSYKGSRIKWWHVTTDPVA